MRRRTSPCWAILLQSILALSIGAAPTPDWSKSLGVHSVARPGSAAADRDGNVFAIGVFEGSLDLGGGPIHCSGLAGVFLVKYDPVGNHVWSRAFGGETHAHGRSLAVDAAGNVFVSGYFDDTIDFGTGPLTAVGPGDLFLAKFDNDGNCLWSKRFGDGNYQEDWRLCADKSGNVILVGDNCCSIDFGGGWLTSSGSDDAFVAKLDADGNHLWSKRFGDAGQQEVAAIATNEADELFVTGSFRDGIDFGLGTLTSASTRDVFVVKFDADGNAVWNRQFGGDHSQRTTSITTDDFDNVFFAGWFSGNLDFGGGVCSSPNDFDGFLASLDADGNHRWSLCYGADVGVSSQHVASMASGDVFVSGHFSGSADFGGGAGLSASERSSFVASFDVDGNHLFSRILSSARDLTFSTLALDGADNALLFGHLSGTVDLGSGPLATELTDDAAIVKLDASGAEVWSRDLAQLSGYGRTIALAVDAAGNLAVSGFFDGTIDLGTGALTNLESTDTLIGKFDQDGQALWSRRIGDGYLYSYLAVTADGLGNVVAAGLFDSVVDFGAGPLPSAGGDDLYVAKFDADGNYLWAHRLGDESNQAGLGTAVDQLGNVFVTGFFSGAVDFGGGPLVGVGDVCVVKFDPDGNHLWSRGFGDATGGQYARAIVTDSAGNVVIAGYNDGSVDFGGGPLSGDFDCFIAKFDPDGNHLWSRNYGEDARPYLEGLAIDGVGNVILVGSYFGSLDFGAGPLPSAGRRDVFVVSFDADGVHRWSRRFGDGEEQLGAAVAVQPGSDHVLITGQFKGTLDLGGGPFANLGEVDIFVASFDSNGNHVWSRRFEGASAAWATSIVADAQGGFTIAGYLEGPIDFGGGIVRASSRGHAFLARFQDPGVPVRFAHFEATLQQRAVRLRWEVRSDDARERFSLLRWEELSSEPIAVAQGSLLEAVPFFVDGGVKPGRSYHYQIVVRTAAGEQLRSEIVSVTTPALRATLAQNAPNPFNPSTVIEYSLGERSEATLVVYDAAGKVVVRLEQGLREPGVHRVEWDGRDGGGHELASGVYFYRLAGVRNLPSRKLLLLR